MPRQARILSKSGYMHLIVRGIVRQIMFEEAVDYQLFLSLLERFCGEKESIRTVPIDSAEAEIPPQNDRSPS